MAERLFGRDVVGRAEHAPADRQPGLVAAARDPEVGDLGARLGVEQDVLGLDVAMHDAVRVRGVERARDLDRERDGLGDRQPPDPADALLQRLALDVFEHDERHAVVLARVEHGDDVGVLKLRDRARLAAEALDVLALAADRAGQHLDRDAPLEHGVEGEPDPRRRARADLALEPVATADDGLRRRAHRRVLCALATTEPPDLAGRRQSRLHGRRRLPAPRRARPRSGPLKLVYRTIPRPGSVTVPAASLTRPMTRAPGWCSASRAAAASASAARDDGDEAAAHVEDLVGLRGVDRAGLAEPLADARDGQRGVDLEADGAVRDA